MIKPIKAGESLPGGYVDRVIDIYWGSGSVSRTFNCIEYECLYRIDGQWYISEQCDGPNGGHSSQRLPDVNDSNVEAFAEEQKAKWQKFRGISDNSSERLAAPAEKPDRSRTRHGKAFAGLLKRYFGK